MKNVLSLLKIETIIIFLPSFLNSSWDSNPANKAANKFLWSNK
jgi:ubiquitin-protein ligase